MRSKVRIAGGAAFTLAVAAGMFVDARAAEHPKQIPNNAIELAWSPGGPVANAAIDFISFFRAA